MRRYHRRYTSTKGLLLFVPIAAIIAGASLFAAREPAPAIMLLVVLVFVAIVVAIFSTLTVEVTDRELCSASPSRASAEIRERGGAGIPIRAGVYRRSHRPKFAPVLSLERLRRSAFGSSFGCWRLPMSGLGRVGRGTQMRLSVNVALGLMALAAILGVPTLASYAPVGQPDDIERREPERDIKAETDLYCVAVAIFFEGGSTAETLEGQRHIARVVTERAKAGLRKWGGRDLCEVVFYKRAGVCQFSFACLPLEYRTPRGGVRWETALAVAREELAGQSEVSESSIRYYMNPALTSDRNACRFRKEFVPVLEAGRHHFFREPTVEERRQLANSEPEECRRYKAALELQKKRAKVAAEKRRKALVLARAKAQAKAKETRVAVK